MKAKKRVTKLVFMVVIVFIGESWLVFGSVQLFKLYFSLLGSNTHCISEEIFLS